jgi:adenylate cyclase
MDLTVSRGAPKSGFAELGSDGSPRPDSPRTLASDRYPARLSARAGRIQKSVVADSKLDPLRRAILGRRDATIDVESEGLLDELPPDGDRDGRRELLEKLAQDGATVEELRDAVARDRLPLLALERALAVDGRVHYTLAQLAERSGLSDDFLRALRRALGLAQVEPQVEHATESDVEAARAVQRFREAGLPDEGLLEVARVLGHSMSLVAATIRRVLAAAFEEDGDSELEAALRYADAAKQLVEELDPLLGYALAVHQREQIGSEVIGRAGDAAPFPGAEEVTVCFADLVGFTELGQEISPSDLGRIVGRLTDLAVDCVRPPVRLVKMIGDAALLVSHDSDAALLTALELMDAVAADEELPVLRVGLTRGHAISRGGEWYGTPVNVASKLTASAPAGRVIATAEVRAATENGFAWSRRQRRRLPGVRRPLDVFEVGLPPESRAEPWPGYDRATVVEVKQRLASGTADMRRRVRLYERRHKQRKGVLRAVATAGP